MSDRAALMREMEELEARKRKLDCEILKRRDRSEAKLAEADVHSAAAVALMQTTRVTRAAARAAARAAERRLIELPADVLGLVLYQLPLAHDIALAGLTCRALCDAAKLAIKARPYSGEVVTLAGHTNWVYGLAAAPDGRVLTGADGTVKMWRDGACVRNIDADNKYVHAVAVLPGGVRFIGGPGDGIVKLWTLEGALERTFAVGGNVTCVAALPDGVHFVVGLGTGRNCGEVRLSRVRRWRRRAR